MKIAYENIKLSDFKSLTNFNIICDADEQMVRLEPKKEEPINELVIELLYDYNEGEYVEK